MLREITNFCSKKRITKLVLDYLNIDTVFLNYHRVISNEEYLKNDRPDNNLVVSSSIFEEQIKFLKKNFNVISINDISKNLEIKKKIVITFDDGYLDNYENALPILKKYNCPAIIYVVTSFLDNKNYPWWLKIWKIIQQNNNIIYQKEKIDVSNKHLKFKIYHFFCNKISLMKHSEQNLFFENLSKNLRDFQFGKNNEFLSSDDLIKLNKNDFIEIGCHTHYHQNLRILSDQELNEEINLSKSLLEKILNKKINHFSIPFGTKNTFSSKSIELLKKFNFQTIVTTEHGNFNKKKIFRIPRIGIGNNDLENSLYSKALGFDSIINKILNR